MNPTRTPAALTAAEEREWLEQERAWREECAGADGTTAAAAVANTNAQMADGSALASYRAVARALRAPIAPALPADFARNIAAQCRMHPPAPVDAGLELQVQRALLGLLAVAAVAAIAIYGGDWWRATATALPVLGDSTTRNWTVALGACLGLSWALDMLRRRSLA